MATQTLFQERRTDFQQLVQGWDRRLRVQQAFVWLPRCLLPGLIIGIAVGIISRLRPWLGGAQILSVTGILLVIGLAIMAIIVWWWPRSIVTAARHFDR